MSTESTGTSSFDDAESPSPPKKIKSEEDDDDEPDIDAVLAADSDTSDGELNDRDGLWDIFDFIENIFQNLMSNKVENLARKHP